MIIAANVANEKRWHNDYIIILQIPNDLRTTVKLHSITSKFQRYSFSRND